MARRYKRQYEEDGSIWNMIEGLGGLYFLYLLFQYFTNRANFWRWLIYGFVAIFAMITAAILFRKFKEYRREKRIINIIDSVRKAELGDYVKNFITRFGLGQEKSKNVWQKRNYHIDWNRINDLKNFLHTRGVNLTFSDISILLSHYIDEREYDVTSNSIKTTTQNFGRLNGGDFERLLYHLYEAMGYNIQLSGRTGDQGGDLVATKGQERILIQAKCYHNKMVGNDAVQQAVAAKSFYDCNKAVVITISDFTREAVELAKVNNVELIPKMLLQKMLLDYLKESWG